MSYYKNGDLFIKSNYKNGLSHGSWISYWRNGQLWSKGNYKNNKKEGKWFEYDKYGRSKYEYTGTFKNDKKISN